jgi:hypothetical protein
MRYGCGEQQTVSAHAVLKAGPLSCNRLAASSPASGSIAMPIGILLKNKFNARSRACISLGPRHAMIAGNTLRCLIRPNVTCISTPTGGSFTGIS